jgi:hypothetical protein
MSRTTAKLPTCEFSSNLFVVLTSYKRTEWYSVLLNPELSQMQMLIFSLFFSIPPGKLQDRTVIFKQPTFPHANAHKKKPWNSFYIFRQKGNLLHFKICCIITILYSTTCPLLHNFIFSCSNHTQIFHKPFHKILMPIWLLKG